LNRGLIDFLPFKSIFTPEIEKICLEKFFEFDTDKSGSIDRDEMVNVLKALGKTPSKEEIDKMVGEF
jgi:Ca2+-binding EF-hand superfamily protein